MKKYNYLDLFAGCGGLSDGFEKTGKYELIGAVEWEKDPISTLINRLNNKWNIMDSHKKCLRFDMQRTEELLFGWKNDEVYGNGEGLKKKVGSKKIDVIVGGPPCQAYSIAGRVRDENGMHDDYRNYLFESYIKIVKEFQPKIFIFENVPGLLSAKPGGIDIKKKIVDEFRKINFEVIDDLKLALIDASEYGVPQNRKRIIILGINKNYFKENNQAILEDFYKNIITKFKEKKVTVREAIGDLEKLYPLDKEIKVNNKKFSHYPSFTELEAHFPRYHNKRDIEIFTKLTKDIETNKNLYSNIDNIKKLYTEKTGKASNVHKYYVLRWEEQSNTIVAHLYKDGLRHIHPDSKQARSITIRESARLQTFDDDFVFLGSSGSQYKMIGNAVPPKLSEKISKAVKIFIEKY